MEQKETVEEPEPERKETVEDPEQKETVEDPERDPEPEPGSVGTRQAVGELVERKCRQPDPNW